MHDWAGAWALAGTPVKFWDCIYDIYVWKNTQLGPLLIYFKRREAHKSSCRAKCSQKVVDVWIASTASSLHSVFSPWLASLKSLATGTLQDHLQKGYQKDSFFMLPNTTLFEWPHGLLIACLKKNPMLGRLPSSPKILSLLSLTGISIHLQISQGRKVFDPPTQYLFTKTHCFCYQRKPNSCSLTFFFFCRAAFFSRKSITLDN